MKAKNLLLSLMILVANLATAQAPTNYYDGTAGLTGATLKTKLSEIITNGHRDNGYSGLWTAYATTDRDNYYENDATILDMYSENPAGTDPYTFTYSTDQCGNYGTEGDCYNREHIVPQSLFGSDSPMVSDIHHIPPTDGKVNGMRSNYPFGVVTNPSYTSANGSKVGPNTTAGFSGTVFEPINEFKGDIARMVFYFVTRYEGQLSGFSTGNILGGSAYPGLQNWELNVLLSWHNADPVSQREIDRNNAAYAYQGNRNPYIDSPQWVATVWGGGSSTDTQAPTAPTNLMVTGTTASSVSLSWSASTDNVGVTGYEVYQNGIFQFVATGTTATVNNLAASTTYNFSVVAKDTSGNLSAESNTVQGTTLAGSGGNTGTVCGTEDFENIPSTNPGGYATRTWTNATSGITWTATDARTDQQISTGKAITVRNGSLSSTTISGGISTLTVTTQREFTGGSGFFNLYINGDMVGQIPYSDAPTTTTITNINVEGNFTMSITDNSVATERVSFDNLSWTCYTAPLATSDPSLNELAIYPNPVKDQRIFVKGAQLNKIERAEIYGLDGRLLQRVSKPFVAGNSLTLRNLPKGIYLLRLDQKTFKFMVD